MREQTWYKVSIWLRGNGIPIVISMTLVEITDLKIIKREGKSYYFQTSHNELSDKFFVDVTEIVAIKEVIEFGG